jgi:hypothetical protein
MQRIPVVNIKLNYYFWRLLPLSGSYEIECLKIDIGMAEEGAAKIYTAWAVINILNLSIQLTHAV